MKKYQKQRLFLIAFILGIFALVIAAGAVGMRSQQIRTQVESMRYAVSGERDGYELRTYEPHLMAQYFAQANERIAWFEGWDHVMAYFQWHNRITPATEGGEDHTRIRFTTPILMQGHEPGAENVEGHWVGLVLPEEFTAETAPVPRNEAVKVEAKPGYTAAAIRFNGGGGMEDMHEHEELLRALLKRDNIATSGPPLYARYDPPWTIPIFRRNEIIIPVTL